MKCAKYVYRNRFTGLDDLSRVARSDIEPDLSTKKKMKRIEENVSIS